MSGDGDYVCTWLIKAKLIETKLVEAKLTEAKLTEAKLCPSLKNLLL